LHISNNQAATSIATFENIQSHEASVRFKTAHSAASDYRVGASISVSNAFEVYSQDAATSRLVIDSSGNVRIGYDNSLSYPSDAKLMVSNAGTNGMEFSNTALSGQNRILNYNRTTSSYVPLTIIGSELKFGIGTSEAMRIDSKGMIGVQSAMPSDVSGDCTSIRVGGLSVIGGVTGTSGKQNFHTGLYYNAYPTSSTLNKALVSKGSGNDYRPVKYVQKSGQNWWYNAGSATAGSDITWTERMSLNQNGSLSLYNGTNSIYQYVRAPGGLMGTFFSGSVNNSSADYDISFLNPATNNNSGGFLMTTRETSSPSLGRVRTFILFLNDTGIATTQLSTNGSTAASLSFSRPNENTLRVTASNYNVHYINIIPIAGAQF
jgi:hypothetical protein